MNNKKRKIIGGLCGLLVGCLGTTGVCADAPAKSPQTVTQVSGVFANLKVFPNPWRADQHAGSTGGATFANLPTGSTIKIFTTSGHWVRTLSPQAGSSSVLWDLTNNKGSKVASGVYLYNVSAGSEKTSGKLVIIK